MKIRNIFIRCAAGWLMFGSLVCSFSLSALSPDFSQCRLKTDERQGSVWIYGSGTPSSFIGGIGVHPKTEFSKLKASVQDGALVIDAREVLQNSPGSSAMVRFYQIDLKNAVKLPPGTVKTSKLNRMAVELKSAEPTQIALLFEGQQLIDGKQRHYWKSKDIMLNGTWQTVTFDQAFPDNLQNVWIRIDIRKPAEIAIRRVTFGQVSKAEKEIDPNVNHIRNGGAEHGWDGTYVNPLRNYQLSATGVYTDWMKREVKDEIKFTLDSDEKYDGEYSFRMERPAAKMVHGSLRFNPVPFIVGKPATFSFYAKAEKNMKVEICWFLASGIAVVKNVLVGTHWKKYELQTPAWGEKSSKYHIIGDITNGYGAKAGVAIPVITPKQPGTLWVDNAAHSIGMKAVFKEKEQIFVSHKLNKDAGYYFADESVEAEVSFRSVLNKPVSGELDCEILDIFGKTSAKQSFGKIELPLKGRLKKNVKLEVPANLRGPVNAVFFLKTKNKVYKSVAYFGIIERGGALNKRIGIELRAMQNVKMAIPYCRDFRFGSVRIGSASGNFEYAFLNAPYLKDAGFDVMMNMSYSRKGSLNPEIAAKEFASMNKCLAEYGKYIDVLEVQNEPNITPGWDVERNIKMIGDVDHLLKKHDLKAKLAGPVVNQTDFSWIAGVLRSGKGKLLKAVTEHPYRKIPELPDYVPDVRSVRKLIDMYQPGLPYYATEAGTIIPNMLPSGYIDDHFRLSAARDLRRAINGFAAGLERYYHFSLTVWPEGSAWQCLFAGSPANNGIPVPAPTIYAFRTLADRLEEATCVRQIRLGQDCRCFVFDHGFKRTAVLWKWNGKPGILTFAPEDVSKLLAYNFVGSRIKPETLDMNEYPVYLDSTLSDVELENIIKRATLISDGSSMLAASTAVLAQDKFAVDIRNKTGRVIKNIKVIISTRNSIIGASERTIPEIGPEENSRVEFKLTTPISTADKKIVINVTGAGTAVTLNANLRALTVVKTSVPLKIDGELSDWPMNVPIIVLDKNNVDSKSKTIAWGEKEDRIKAELRYAWDDNFLYTAVVVHKKDYFPVMEQPPFTSAYKQDSVQICYDPLRNAKPGANLLEDDDFEYCFFEAHSKSVVTRRWASSAVYDSLGKECGVLTKQEVPFAVRRYADKTVYEMAFPRKAVSPFALRPYSTMRAGLIININNGKERVGWIELTPGIGQNPKRPDQWMDLVLLP